MPDMQPTFTLDAVAQRIFALRGLAYPINSNALGEG
jgi:hypothetical protein